MTQETDCTLCGLEAPASPILDEADRIFCCTGCHAVFQILKTQNQQDRFDKHPVFQQALKSGLIGNPRLVEELKSKRIENEETISLHLEIGDLWCPSCAEVIQWVLLREPGIKQCVVDYTTDLASIEYSPMRISKERLLSIIRKLGYTPILLESPERRAVSSSLKLRLGIASFCALNIMMLSYPVYASYFSSEAADASLFAWLCMCFSLPVITYCAWPIVKRCLGALSIGIMGMELLVVIGVSAAFGLSLFNLLRGNLHIYFDSMSVIVAFVLLGKVIESKAKFTAKDSLLRIAKSLPKRGRKRFPDGAQKFIPLKEVRKGDCLMVFSGEKAVLDGEIIEGGGWIEESAMTGEALPIRKEIGDGVLAGSILLHGWAAVKVTAELEETALHRIVEMVEQDIHRKTPYVRMADKVVQWFVPAVALTAGLTALLAWAFGITDAGYGAAETGAIRAITILLIACPCAIGIAAPLAESRLIYQMASLGAIIRNRGALRLLGKETAFVFDKTGTITTGTFEVCKPLSELDAEQLPTLKGMTGYSNHPVSSAIYNAIGAEAVQPEAITEHPGLGLEAHHNGKKYLLGSAKFMALHRIFAPKISIKGKTIVYFSENNKLLAAVSLGDSIRPKAKETVSLCKPAITCLVSGDCNEAVKEAAEVCGFNHFLSEQSPLQKRDEIERLKANGQIVGMIGDGINDAPALSSAHVSVSVVNAAEISVQVSDVLLTRDRLETLTEIRLLARRGRRISFQNIFWAFGYNVIGIALAAFGTLSPIFSAAAMVSSSIMVVANTRRITPSRE